MHRNGIHDLWIAALCAPLLIGCSAAPISQPSAGERETSTVRGTISWGFVAPNLKQGLLDHRLAIPSSHQTARYAKLKAIGMGYRQYNLYWSMLEDWNTTSSSRPMACGPGFVLTPANEAERVAGGYRRFRCINRTIRNQFDDLFERDRRAGFQSGVVLWSAAPQYRYPGCLGFNHGGRTEKGGCVPRDNAHHDFEDYINFVAQRWGYRGRDERRRNIRHFIVWNEAASDDWLDFSPRTVKGRSSTFDINMRIGKYVHMMRMSHWALARHTRGVLMYASTDQLWAAGQHRGHLGTKALLDGIWSQLGTSIPWGVAVHPYGDAMAPAPKNQYTFQNLEMVVDYQKGKLAQEGRSTADRQPWTYLIASEQGWPRRTADGVSPRGTAFDDAARNICAAHAKALSMPNLVAVAHNFFHEVHAESQDLAYGLLPAAVSNDLSNMELYATGRAYAATGSGFGRSNDNHCCRDWGIGCARVGPTAPRTVTVYRHRKAASGDHRCSLARSLPDYTLEAPLFEFYQSDGANRAQVFTCRIGQNHFISRDPNCEGQIVVEALGWGSTRQDSSTPRPVYRCYQPTVGDHLTTLDSGECQRAGYQRAALGIYVP